MPRVVGPVRRTRPVEVDDLRFLRSRTDRTVKITLPGPFTMSQQAYNEAYADEAELAMDFAAAVNEEVRDLFAAGADIVQIDEPWLQSRAEKAREFALPAIDRALEGVSGTTALHTCFGYAHIVHDRPPGYPFLAELAGCAADVLAIEAAQPRLDPAVLAPLAGKTVIVGVLDLADERAGDARARSRSGSRRCCEVIPPERLQVGPDCGMKYLSRDARVRQAAGARGGRADRPRAARLGPQRRGHVAAGRAPHGAACRRARGRAASAPRRTAKRSSGSARNGWKSNAGSAVAGGRLQRRVERPRAAGPAAATSPDPRNRSRRLPKCGR